MGILSVICIVCFAGVSYAQDCDDIPELNRQIVQIAHKYKSKKVGRGECWDLAQLVLNETGAEWDGYEVYGRKINRKKECVYPGDIIQFEKVKLKYTEGNLTYTESMYHHTAIVKEVLSNNEVVLLHQNTAATGRKVGESNLRFDTITKGELFIYRPVPGN